MTELLSRLFVKNREKTDDPTVRGSYATLACVVGIILNVLLFIGKLAVGILAFSVAIIADAFNNLSDAGSSVVSLIGFKLSAKPVDKEHPMGHGRMEYVSAFIVDMIIILVGFELLTSSVEKIITPTGTEASLATLILLGAAILFKIWLFIFYGSIGKRISSQAILASSKDSFTDAIATSLVFVTSLFSYLGILESFPLDGVAGILVAGFILYTGIKAAGETIDLLLGAPPEKEYTDAILAFCESYDGVIGIHDLIVHDYGPGRRIVSLHAEVPSDADINIAHEAIDRMERDMCERFNCIATVHLDPIVMNDERVNAMREFAAEVAKELDPSFTIHDFRMTSGEERTNLIFDLVLPIDSKMKPEDAASKLAALINEKRSDCFAVILAEKPFI